MNVIDTVNNFFHDFNSIQSFFAMVHHNTLWFESLQNFLINPLCFLTIAGAPSVVSPDIFLGSDRNF